VNNIKILVDKTVKKYGTRDPFKIANELDVILLTVPLKDVNGFYQYYKRNYIIYLNDKLDDNRRRIILAHELGHLFLHKKTNAIFMSYYTAFNKSKMEKQADIFASELLISDDDILEYKGFTREQIAISLGVDIEYVNYKIDNLVITK
jgi:Zn-dependent peptidase ImmA (M78 family)